MRRRPTHLEGRRSREDRQRRRPDHPFPQAPAADPGQPARADGSRGRWHRRRRGRRSGRSADATLNMVAVMSSPVASAPPARSCPTAAVDHPGGLVMGLDRHTTAAQQHQVGVHHMHRGPAAAGQGGGVAHGHLAGRRLVDGQQDPLEHDPLLVLRRPARVRTRPTRRRLPPCYREAPPPKPARSSTRCRPVRSAPSRTPGGPTLRTARSEGVIPPTGQAVPVVRPGGRWSA